MPPADPVVDARPAITGVGLATCLGTDAAATWRAVLGGENGFGPMAAMEWPLPPGSDGGEARPLPVDYRPDLPREARYLRWTVEATLTDAGYATGGGGLPCEPGRAAVMLGTTLHGMRAGGRFLRNDDAGELSSFLAGDTLRLAFDGLGLRGATATTCSACSSSLGSVALAATILASGEADLVVAGGYDTISEYVWGGFNALRLVADGPPMPFCVNRPGMKLAEGYGIVVLERAGDVAARGRRPLAVVSGWGESSDAYHLTRPHPDGEGAARAMTAALDAAGLPASAVDLAAAHATGTPDNDSGEFAALSRTFGDGLSDVPVVAYKSHLGHTLGGAGVVEMILTALALRDGVVPPTARVRPEQVEFGGLNVTHGDPRPADLRHAISTSLGFGGANTSVVLSRPDAATPFVAGRRSAEAVVTGVGVVLPGATGNAAFLARLAGGDRPPATIGPEQLAALVDARKTRRMSGYVKLTLAVVRLALEQAGLLGDAARLRSTAAILGTTHGSPEFCYDYYAKIVRDGVKTANPALFAEGVPNAAAAQVSIAYGLGGPCQTIIGSRTSGLDALRLAAERIRQGRCDRVIVAAAEETHPSLDRAYSACGLQRGDANAAGFVPSPGGVCLVLESRRGADERGATVLGGIGPAVAFNGGAARLPRTLAQVLAALPATAVVVGSANGTRLDAAERLAVGESAVLLGAYGRLGELFSATPLAGVAAALLGGRLDPRRLDPLEVSAAGRHSGARPAAGGDVAVICTDWSGPAAGTVVRVTGD